MYTLLQTYELSSCSQTVEWFEGSVIENDCKIGDVLIGTNTTSQNYLQQINVGLPLDSSSADYNSYR